MAARARLTDAEIEAGLGNIDGWKHLGDGNRRGVNRFDWIEGNGSVITRTFEFRDFVDALGFIAKVGGLAEQMNHHPEIVNIYNRVRITLNTHDSDGVTDLALKLAMEINNHL